MISQYNTMVLIFIILSNMYIAIIQILITVFPIYIKFLSQGIHACRTPSHTQCIVHPIWLYLQLPPLLPVSSHQQQTISRTSFGAILVLVVIVLGFRNVSSSSHPYSVTLDFDGTLKRTLPWVHASGPPGNKLVWCFQRLLQILVIWYTVWQEYES